MTPKKQQLRKDIIEKFETIKYFCKKAKFTYSNFKTFLNSKTPNEELYQDAVYKLESIEVDHIEGHIKDEDRESIRVCILIQAGSYAAFHKNHKRFDSLYISNIVKGRLKNETPKYRKLVRILKRDYNLILESDEPIKTI